MTSNKVKNSQNACGSMFQGDSKSFKKCSSTLVDHDSGARMAMTG